MGLRWSQARVVKVPSAKGGKISTWVDEVLVLRVVECHPPQYRPLAVVGAACGLRQGEIFGLAEEDIDFDEMVIHVRRQVKKLGRDFVFALPKNDTERDLPMSEGAGLVLQEHIAAIKPRPYTLPWEKLDGRPRSVNLLFRWTDDKHIRARTYDEMVWKAALAQAGVIPMPTKDARGRRQYKTARDAGMHALATATRASRWPTASTSKNGRSTWATETLDSPSASTRTCCRRRMSGRGKPWTPGCPVCSPSQLTEL